eukprot:3002247-Pyramimonas_sp.AAC.1
MGPGGPSSGRYGAPRMRRKVFGGVLCFLRGEDGDVVFLLELQARVPVCLEAGGVETNEVDVVWGVASRVAW